MLGNGTCLGMARAERPLFPKAVIQIHENLEI